MESENSVYCNCLYYSANSLARLMAKMADEEFSAVGLSSSYALLLMSVNSRPGIQPKQLCCQMQLSPSTITRLIEKMEYKGFLTRKHIGRITEVYPSEKSKNIDSKIKDAWRNLYEKYSGILGEELAQKLTSDVHEASNKLYGQ